MGPIGYLRVHTHDEINIAGMKISAAQLICIRGFRAVETDRYTSIAGLRLEACFPPH